MTTYYFVGGEDHDFTRIGTGSVDTATTAARRTAYARCSLKATGGFGDGWVGTFTSAVSTFWFTARLYNASSGSNGYEIFAFRDSNGLKRLVLLCTSSNSFKIVKRDTSANNTDLVSNIGTSNIANGVLSKLDIFINYATSGSIQMYLDGTLVANYTGDITTNGSTSLAGFIMNGTSGNGAYWSEVICCDTDTRALGLGTVSPSATGNAFTFDSGSVSSINETTLDDSTIITSGTAGQIAEFTVSSLVPSISGYAIKGLFITARSSKGPTGPQTMKGTVRTGGADYSTASQALQNASFGRVTYSFLTNPATSSAWAATDFSAGGFNIGLTSDV